MRFDKALLGSAASTIECESRFEIIMLGKSFTRDS